MNVFKHNRSIIIMLTLLLSNSVLAATTYSCKQFGKKFSTTLPGYNSGGFNVANSSCSTLINSNWSNFGMEKSYWDDGWGYYNACSVNNPLNRTLRALELLRISKNPRFSSSVLLNSAYDLSKKWIHRLRMGCAKNSKNNVVATHFGNHVPQMIKDMKDRGIPDWAVDRMSREWDKENGSGIVSLYLPAFGQSIVDLSASILHEARHKIKPHNGASGCPAKGSCDKDYRYNGANTYELNYSWWYGIYGKNSTKITRQMGLDRARTVQNRRFNTRPAFNIRKIAR